MFFKKLHMKYKNFLIILLLSIILAKPGYAQEDAGIYAMGIKAARDRNMDFAFMHFRALVNDFPASKYKEKALFAVGEYYFSLPSHAPAAVTFKSFLSEYPDSKAKLFALMYLFKIAEIRNNENLRNDLETRIINFKQVSLVFRDFKEYFYRSSLKDYKAAFHIDRIEFFVAGEPFANISF